MRKPDTDETIGNNVHGIRIARRISMQEAVNGMGNSDTAGAKPLCSASSTTPAAYWHQKHLIFSSALDMTPKKTSC